jgi:hypothetical protein
MMDDDGLVYEATTLAKNHTHGSLGRSGGGSKNCGGRIRRDRRLQTHNRHIRGPRGTSHLGPLETASLKPVAAMTSHMFWSQDPSPGGYVPSELPTQSPRYPPQYPPYPSTASPNYPPPFPPPPRQKEFGAAGVLFGLAAVRDLFFLWEVQSGRYALDTMILGGLLDLGIFNLVLPGLGIVGCVMAAACSTGNAPREVGFIGAILAVVGSSVPGFFGIGFVGLILTTIGIVLLFVQLARKHS